MRLTYLLVVAVTGLLACCDAAAPSDSEKTVVNSRDQVLANRELIDGGVSDNVKRSLRVNAEDDSENPKTDAKSNEERFSLIQSSNTPRYYYWFDEEMTPRDVKVELGLTKVNYVVNPVTVSIYKGYVKYYKKKCQRFKYRDADFCQPGAQ
uniref:RxLR effector protein n=1 Tax=Phytophthora agathidicida TaxID=1642459 RepID=A0A7G4WHZ5_9STRA|nr:PaRXLR6 [Phytophthora agathidicida]